MTTQEIIELVVNHTGISLEVMKSKSRRRDVVDARNIAVYLLKQEIVKEVVVYRQHVISDSEIAGLLNMTRVNVTCSRRTWRGLMDSYKVIRDTTEGLMEEIKSHVPDAGEMMSDFWIDKLVNKKI
jgi:hypothetical protein